MQPEPRTYNARSALRLGRSLVSLRKSRGLTQAALAERARVSRQWLITAERGESDRLEIGRLMQVLDALDATLTIQDDGQVAP
jgi:HTH-type transcriptional regulator / antitoxin HipB